MAAFSNYMENTLIDLLFRGGSYSPPTPLYITLCTSIPSASNNGSSIAEPGGSYARQSVATGPTNWYSTQGDTTFPSSGSSGASGNVNPISWSSVTWSATVTAIAICDQLTGGNLLWFGALQGGSKTVNVGDNITFAINGLQPSLS